MLPHRCDASLYNQGCVRHRFNVFGEKTRRVNVRPWLQYLPRRKFNLLLFTAVVCNIALMLCLSPSWCLSVDWQFQGEHLNVAPRRRQILADNLCTIALTIAAATTSAFPAAVVGHKLKRNDA